ncbi:MAG: zeta toxin family protein [Prevotella sp.]|nr:zeta toxin family protein [Prevotella sp.]
MLESDVLKIFWDNKENTIPYNLSVSSNPKAILLGGQGAVGKSNLVDIIKEDNEGRDFLSINGDDFRIFHPGFHALVENEIKFPRETQVFSNVFTKNLIDIGAENKLNMIVEGTIRDPSVPISTAEELKNKGYSVEAYIIAAPKEISSIIGYSRYVEDRRNQGYGRMLDMKSHNQTANGLPKSIDELSERGLVETLNYAADQADWVFLRNDRVYSLRKSIV